MRTDTLVTGRNAALQSALPSSPTIIVYVNGGVVQWTAANDLSLAVLILDGDGQDTSQQAVAWHDQTIPISSVDPDLLEIALSVHPTPGSPDSRPHAARELPTCAYCNSRDWKVSEQVISRMRHGSSMVLPVETIERWFWCADCGSAPDDPETLEEAYVSIDADEASIRAAAVDVVLCWEIGDLASAVRRLATALDR